KWPKRKILCCNPEMYDWVYELQTPEFQEGNKNVGLMQLGAFSDRVSELPRVDNSIIVNGKYEPRKGIDIALEALRTLDMQATVQILHPLHTEDDAKAAVTASQGHNLIPFAQSHEDVQALYDVHHVAVFSSCAEGWNMGLTEALGQGCIVVASDISAHRYQYEIMCEYLGEEETDKRFILVPAYEQPMKYHPRWYPAHIYAGHTWLESSSEDIAEGILQALGMPFPEPWEEGQFPLSWEHAARRLLEEIAWTETLTTPSTTPEDESSPST
nr:glycosyltransferase [Anaerolineae bacterium]NIN99703.1 glycosyltransferase [Anaerolineae bacterium]NIQ82555.1 glycosyltransferase [Anaerolineae bacterium]